MHKLTYVLSCSHDKKKIDPHVASAMGSAVIKGLQGNYKKDRTRVAACMKHFIGYSGSRNGQDK